MIPISNAKINVTRKNRVKTWRMQNITFFDQIISDWCRVLDAATIFRQAKEGVTAVLHQ